MKANELKKGMVINVDGQNILIKQVVVQSPSSRSGSTLYKTRGQNVVTRIKFERSYKGDEIVDEVDFNRRPVQLLYRDSDGCTFMDSESYEQFIVAESMLEEELPFISDGLTGLYALVADDTVLGIELPPTVNLEITECSPGIKGASASARTKPATLSTGLVVQVPEYLAPGEVIKVNTETGVYMSRA
ncbi:MAG: elongation factor P-like protein YeiP [Gammaproteobacteria bacterium]|nr:elongation factor P-like protein YeiP [Gammaproteobacteria bacterium]MDH5653776.1 elongation factor P-like protein YeiP [Gammaproteobacteria bacterium]